MMPSIASPEPAHSPIGNLLRRVQSWCTPQIADDVQIAGECLALSWTVVHAIERARAISLSVLLSELHRYGRVLADDYGLTVIANAR
jgi:hypothetical protein